MRTISLFTILLLMGFNQVNAQFETIELPIRQVSADSAESLMGTYQLWGAALPEKISWNPEDSTFTYLPKKITDSILLEKINAFKNLYDSCQCGGFEECIPEYLRYSYEKSIVRSFFVSKSDIHAIDSIMDHQQPEAHHNGYRLHLGFQPYSLSADSSTHSHLYLAPAKYNLSDNSYLDYKIYNIRPDSITQIFYDLTLPCPNGCANSDNQIEDIVLPPCSGNRNSESIIGTPSLFNPRY